MKTSQYASSTTFDSVRRLSRFILVLALLGSALMAGPAVASDRSEPDVHSQYHRQHGRDQSHTLRFDVAENGTRFFFDEAPLLDNGFPAAGNAFVTEGFIYPYGFLDEAENGVTDDGNPTAPDKVIGRWICRGYFIGNGAATTTGAWVITTQYYEFGDEAGRRSFSSEGVEVVDVGVPVKRGITGGTGPFRTARGQVRQTLLGFQPVTEAVKLRFVARVK